MIGLLIPIVRALQIGGRELARRQRVLEENARLVANEKHLSESERAELRRRLRAHQEACEARRERRAAREREKTKLRDLPANIAWGSLPLLFLLVGGGVLVLFLAPLLTWLFP